MEEGSDGRAFDHAPDKMEAPDWPGSFIRGSGCRRVCCQQTARQRAPRLFRLKPRSSDLARPILLRLARDCGRFRVLDLHPMRRTPGGGNGNQTSPDGTKQIIVYHSPRGKSFSGVIRDRYQTIASPTGFSVLITASGGTGYQSPSMGTQY
jgi:hypothetical protein